MYYLTSTLIQKEGRNENRVFSKYTNLHSGNGIHKKEIVTGHLLPGDKIPSVRELASELQVNPNTIQRTFQELERDGVVVTRRGMGRYVTNEGEKIMESKRDGERITSFFYRWNGQFRFFRRRNSYNSSFFIT